MFNNKSIVVFWLLPFGFISGCIPSHYHMGFHHLSEDQTATYYSMVSHKVDAMVGSVEDQFVKQVTKANISPLQPLFSPKLTQQLTKEKIQEINSALTQYKFTGQIDGKEVYNGPSWMLDEGVGKPPFDFYDYVGGFYVLNGNPEAAVEVYTTKINSTIMICGFDISPYNNEKTTPQKIKYLTHESIDKAKLNGRHFKNVP